MVSVFGNVFIVVLKRLRIQNVWEHHNVFFRVYWYLFENTSFDIIGRINCMVGDLQSEFEICIKCIVDFDESVVY